jgi:hypothetical protein
MKYEPHFNGPEYIPERDHERLTTQLARVFNCMKDSKWRTLEEISTITGDPEPSVSAQLRHLRKRRFGSHTVNRKHISRGLFKYQLEPSWDEDDWPVD